MKASVVFVLILSLLGSTVSAQDYILSARSKKIFSPSEIRALIKQSAFDAIKEYQVPAEIFESVYPALEKELWIKAKPVLVGKFRWIENGGSTDNIELYKKELYRGVRDVLLNERAFLKVLAVDQTDRILRFDSEIEVKKDGWLHVTEHIRIYNGDGQQSTLYAEYFPDVSQDVNNDIQHGLVRDFPTDYSNTQGLRVISPFIVKSVLKNGTSENYTSKTLDNGTRLLIGEATTYVPVGVFEYTIIYETKKQLIFHTDKDELYWNVNGTGWVFTADSVTCKIAFPSGSKIFEDACYTGLQGSTAHACSSRKLNDSTILFSTSQRLFSYEGLTVAASIQKGILAAPSSAENLIGLVKDNWPLSAMVGVFIFIFSINYRNWRKFGKDPEQGTIIPRFEPPADLSPADVGFIQKQKYAPEQFSAALVDIAVKKGIVIEVEEDGMIFKKMYTHLKRGPILVTN